MGSPLKSPASKKLRADASGDISDEDLDGKKENENKKEEALTISSMRKLMGEYNKSIQKPEGGPYHIA